MSRFTPPIQRHVRQERIAPQRARMLSNRPYVANQSLANFPNSVCHTGKL